MPQREPFRFRTRIRFIDTDASGRIHYTSMFRYFESAEIELLRTVGITYDLRRSYAFPRVHVECDFMGAIAHDDLIEIEAALIKLGRSSAHFQFRTFKDAALAAKGSVVWHAWIGIPSEQSLFLTMSAQSLYRYSKSRAKPAHDCAYPPLNKRLHAAISLAIRHAPSSCSNKLCSACVEAISATRK